MKNQSVYKGEFSCWKDVVMSFSHYTENQEEVLKKHKEPSEVYYANYDIDGYEGSASVIWRQGKKYYYLTGSHCSCYGLEEGGFDPEEFDNKKIFIEFLNKSYIYTMTDEEKKNLLDTLNKK